MSNKFNLPNLGFGVGLRPDHYDVILSQKPDLGWLEIISENYMDTDGKPKRMLEKIAAHYPIVMHGVAMSIGSTDPLNKEYLKKLKDLADWVKPAWISDHLCWTGIAHQNTHDLLPVPYTQEALDHIVDRIKQVQDFLGREILLENPSTYMEFKASQMPEWEFIARMADQADCGLLLDVNNVYVSCYNHRLDSKTYLDGLPMDRVVQIHLAGHDNRGTHIVDTHDGQVVDAVWDLYSYVIGKTGAVSTMVEWDDQIPDFDVLYKEVQKARTHAQRSVVLSCVAVPSPAPANDGALPDLYHQLQTSIIDGDVAAQNPDLWVRDKKDFPPEKQVGVYVDAYRFRLFDVVREDFEGTRAYLGAEKFDDLLRDYIECTPSIHWNIAHYMRGFPDYLKTKNMDGFAVEMARLEREIMVVFDAPETNVFDQTIFSRLTPAEFMEQVLQTRSAFSLLAFDHPVHDYLRAVQNEGDLPAPAVLPSFVAVWRDDDVVWRAALDKDEYALLKFIQDGLPVGAAIEKMAYQSDRSPDALMTMVQNWFHRWTENHFLAA